MGYAAWFSGVKYGTGWSSMARPGMVKHSKVWHGKARQGNDSKAR